MVSALRLRGEVVKLTYSFTPQPCPSKETVSPLHRCFSAVRLQAPPMRSQPKAMQMRLTKNPPSPTNAKDEIRGKQKRIKMIKVIWMRKIPSPWKGHPRKKVMNMMVCLMTLWLRRMMMIRTMTQTMRQERKAKAKASLVKQPTKRRRRQNLCCWFKIFFYIFKVLCNTVLLASSFYFLVSEKTDSKTLATLEGKEEWQQDEEGQSQWWKNKAWHISRGRRCGTGQNDAITEFCWSWLSGRSYWIFSRVQFWYNFDILNPAINSMDFVEEKQYSWFKVLLHWFFFILVFNQRFQQRLWKIQGSLTRWRQTSRLQQVSWNPRSQRRRRRHPRTWVILGLGF